MRKPNFICCSVCGKENVYAKGRCLSCYSSFARYGVDITRVSDILCSNCSRPVAMLRARKIKAYERCVSCSAYFRRNGVEKEFAPKGTLSLARIGKLLGISRQRVWELSKKVATYKLKQGRYASLADIDSARKGREGREGRDYA